MRILLTGGTSGLGLAMARALAVDHHHIVLTGRDEQRAAATAAGIAAELPGEVHGLGLDVRDAGAVRAARERALELLGGLDVLINNAGLGMRTVNPRFLTEPKPFWEVSTAGFRAVVDTNLTGYFLMASAVVGDLLAAGHGRIVNITVNEGTMTRAGFAPYGPSRAGAEALSRVMAADLAGSCVRVNLLLPGGATRTGMVPDQAAAALAPDALLDPEVMADPIRWLCSPAAADTHDQRITATTWQTWLTTHTRT